MSSKVKGTSNTPVISVAVYRPKPRKSQQLLECVRDHMPVLKSQGLVTARKRIVMKATDGTLLEVFEWKSTKSIEDAHRNPEVGKLWARFDKCCTYMKLNDLIEADQVFAGFEPVDV